MNFPFANYVDCINRCRRSLSTILFEKVLECFLGRNCLLFAIEFLIILCLNFHVTLYKNLRRPAGDDAPRDFDKSCEIFVWYQLMDYRTVAYLTYKL